ncbi:MAG TPA: response regulator [Alphaproteobacteria bacterium]|nr:response regulator [Alphaproteobacteria bacterium]
MSEPDFSGLRVLLVDDDAFLRSLTARVLKGLGFAAVAEAADGRAALALLAREGADIALVDFRMPELDGPGFAAAVRAGTEGAAADLPIVMLSGSSDAGAIATAEASGIDGYLVKPVKRDTVVPALADALRRRGRL